MSRRARHDPELARLAEQLVAEGKATVVGVNPAALAPALAPPTVGGVPEESEAAFQDRVIGLARGCGWRVAHFRAVRVARADGTFFYQTPVAADGEGFPDLELARERLIKVELKTKKRARRKHKDLKPAQLAWRDAYIRAGVEWYCWQPEDWPQIVEVLR